MNHSQLARAALALAVVGATALPATAAQAPATLEDFLAICPVVLFDHTNLGEAQKSVDLRKIDNSPIAFGWATQTFTNKDADRAIVVTKMKFVDRWRDTCVAELPTQMSFKEIEALRATLEAMPAFGPLDGKVYPYPAGTSNATLKTAGIDPLVVVSVAAGGGRTTLSIDVWRAATP